MENIIFDILTQIKKCGFDAFIVGGYVRDKLLNRNTYDIDICTSAKYEDLKQIFPNIKYKNFYCSSLKIDKLNIEITTYRKESNYDGRKPLKIEYANSLSEDLQRRDFTINAICMDEDGNYIDLINGINDLNNKLIKSIGNTDKKINEDILRILRAIRFATILDFKLDEDLENAIMKYASNIKNLSTYRIRLELDKILNSENFEYGIKLIKRFNLDKYLNIKFNNINFCNNLIGMYSQIDVNIDNFFTKDELKKINKLKKYLDNHINVYDLYELGLENIKILSQIKNINLEDDYNKLVIKSDYELDIRFNDIKDILDEKKLKFSDIKGDIIKEILYGNLVNKKDEIIKFITNKY